MCFLGGAGVGSDAQGFQYCRAPDTLTDIPETVLGTVFIVLVCAVADSIVYLENSSFRESH